MDSPSRNSPCPCGSGRKYKKCCLLRDEARRAEGALSPQSRVVTHRGRDLLISSGRDVPSQVLDEARDYFDAKDRGEGPAARLMRFALPLLEGVDESGRADRALELAMIFWNLAILDDKHREEAMAAMVKTMAQSPETAAEFQALAEKMIERHRQMFPALH